MWSFVAYFVLGVAFWRRILSFWQTSSRLVRLPVVFWDWVWFCIPAEIAVVPCPSGYLMLFWVLALTCLPNVQPGHLILSDHFGVVMCFIWKISQNSLNSTDVNWLPLSLTTQSTTPNRANSSCRNLIVVPVVGLLHLRTSGHLE